MNINLNTDFNALLTAAQAQWKLYRKDLAQVEQADYSHIIAGGSISDIASRAYSALRQQLNREYLAWVKENIEDLGIQMVCDHATGKPKSLLIVVAGEDSHIYSAS